MALAIILSAIILVSVAILVWCFLGFFRELDKKPQFSGFILTFRTTMQSAYRERRSQARLIHFPQESPADPSWQRPSGTQPPLRKV